ncbi:MAG: N-acetylmuramic acid 6-phosphate etherase [Actinomycetota bacterium]|jgi:N-acetylmuramic acid 6-phosphate etherase|nr:N-acetylmuramic acid 6-phosphate etherase [Actinomycetota bacterium]
MTSSAADGRAAAGAVTEQRNPRTTDIDVVPTLEVLRLLNGEDARVPTAVEKVLPQLAELVDAAAERVRRGGRLHYFGAGTSGRIAMLDAAELPPTFGVGPGFATAHLAGGEAATRLAVENAEDDLGAGRAAAEALGPEDVALGISASGSAPYVAAALERARERGALTALVSSNPGAPLGGSVDYHLAVDTGPEALTGSTRLKAGTAAKLVLNGFSTALMVRLGRCYSNMMVDVVPTNQKLRRRLVRILVQATGADEEAAREALSRAGDDVKVALVSMLGASPAPAARRALEEAGGQVRAALARLAPAGAEGASPAGATAPSSAP